MVELERRLALAAPVFAWAQFHQVAEAVLELEIHAVQCIGEPTRAALAERHAQARIALEHARPGEPLDEQEPMLIRPKETPPFS
jgi:hypothetical protein